MTHATRTAAILRSATMDELQTIRKGVNSALDRASLSDATRADLVTYKGQVLAEIAGRTNAYGRGC
jgi:hypothetical protein